MSSSPNLFGRDQRHFIYLLKMMMARLGQDGSLSSLKPLLDELNDLELVEKLGFAIPPLTWHTTHADAGLPDLFVSWTDPVGGDETSTFRTPSTPLSHTDTQQLKQTLQQWVAAVEQKPEPLTRYPPLPSPPPDGVEEVLWADPIWRFVWSILQNWRDRPEREGTRCLSEAYGINVDRFNLLVKYELGFSRDPITEGVIFAPAVPQRRVFRIRHPVEDCTLEISETGPVEDLSQSDADKLKSYFVAWLTERDKQLMDRTGECDVDVAIEVSDDDKLERSEKVTHPLDKTHKAILWILADLQQALNRKEIIENLKAEDCMNHIPKGTTTISDKLRQLRDWGYVEKANQSDRYHITSRGQEAAPEALPK